MTTKEKMKKKKSLSLKPEFEKNTKEFRRNEDIEDTSVFSENSYHILMTFQFLSKLKKKLTFGVDTIY